MRVELLPCKKCKKIPKIVKLDDLYYVQCNGACKKWSKYEFLGNTYNNAANEWNFRNTPNNQGVKKNVE